MNWEIKRQLYLAINDAILTSISGLAQNQEPDYIAALINKLPAKLSKILNRYNTDIRYRIGGCFIHQKPIAKFCDPTISQKNPEIGDLLIVYKEINHYQTRYNALLLQAKKTTNIYRTRISSQDEHQLILYSQWPKFQYTKAGYLNGKIRNIIPKTITSGAQYLLIDDQNSANLPFWCAIPNHTLSACSSLALQIIRFLEFQVGRPFVYKPHPDQWSQMILDLLNISATSCFNRRRINYNNSPRYTGNAIEMLLNIDDQIEIDCLEEGISILCVEGTAADSDFQ